MSTITASDVNKLRQQTGAGMMDCKKALQEANGDFELAVEVLRKKGQKVAANRSDREAGEGAILSGVSADGTFGVLLALNCETDFVAKNEAFVGVAKVLLDYAIAEGITEKEELLGRTYPGASITVAEKITEEVGKIGERIEIGTYSTLTGAQVVHYIHPGNRLATLVAFTAPLSAEAGRDVAMQAAAMAPIALDESSVAPELIAKEKEIGMELAMQEGKPADMAEKIADGRIKKWFKEVTLVHQQFIKDNKLTVAEYVKSANSAATVSGFCRTALD
jgi:elongation factor Ts